MALEEHQVAVLLVVRRAPEMVEADVVQCGGRLEAGDMAAELEVLLAGAQHHGGGVPAVDRTDAVLELVVARRFLLATDRDGVQVRGGRVERQVAALAARLLDQRLQQEVRALGALDREHRGERVGPFLGLLGVEIVGKTFSHCCSFTDVGAARARDPRRRLWRRPRTKTSQSNTNSRCHARIRTQMISTREFNRVARHLE